MTTVISDLIGQRVYARFGSDTDVAYLTLGKSPGTVRAINGNFEAIVESAHGILFPAPLHHLCTDYQHAWN